MLDLTDFAVQERPEGNLMVAISQPWYNCSYTMAAKPIKSLELHYTMMQFLINMISGTFKPDSETRVSRLTTWRSFRTKFESHYWQFLEIYFDSRYLSGK